jgi:serine/threonine protein kinase
MDYFGSVFLLTRGWTFMANMALSAERWKEVSPSQFAWEREALDFIRQGLPDCEPYRAWSNFEFIADDGSINEIDLLVFTPQGFFLTEIKSRPGVLTGDAQTWLWKHDGREVALDNPVFLANRKAKKLKALLSRQKACREIRFPFLEALVFCSSPNLDCRLQGNARLRICLRDLVAEAGRPPRAGILAALRRRAADGLPPTFQGQFDAPAARAISRAMEQAGIRQSQRVRRVGDYKLTRLLFENPVGLYQDWEAEHFQLPASKRFVRLYLAMASSSTSERETLKRAARREYEILDHLRHPNLLLVQQYTEHESGPALIFEHDPQAVRLDHFLTQRGAQLSIDTRLELVRQTAEALKFAHDKHAIHGALSPQCILVFAPNAEVPRLKLYNWQTAFRTSSTSTSGLPQVTPTAHPDVFWEDVSRAYHAPELVNDPALRGEHVDVFSLGAIAYHIFSGQPPAGSSLELAEKLRRDRGLKLSSILDGAGEELQMLVEHSTHPEVTVRLASVDEFLDQLARVEEEFTSPTPEVVANPADAKPGDRLQGGFTVKQRFGSGSAAIVFLVEKEGRDLVLKLANQPENNARILDEFESLRKLRHPNVVQAYDKVMVGTLQGFTMQRAGELTLAQRLSKEGRLSLELLERFGDQLLEAINYLDQEGISHRDVKPENLGIGSISGGGKLRLVLFDFSLARTPADNIRAGTTPYLEPFLSQRRPQRWDTQAERYAVGVTLYQMATGQRPVWGDGVSDPAQLNCEVTLDAEKFDAVIRESLLAFFRQALRRDYRQRFDNPEEMLRGWRKIFKGLDQPGPMAPATPGADPPTGLAAAVPESKIAILGLTPRAVAAIDRLGATCVRDFLDVPLRRIYRLPGSRIRQEVVEAFNALRLRFPELVPNRALAKDAESALDVAVSGSTSIDVLASDAFSFVPKKTVPERQVFAALFGITDAGFAWPYIWPATTQVAAQLTLSRGFVEQCLQTARQRWGKSPEMTALRETLASLLQSHGGVMTAADLSLAVLAARGSTEEEPARSAMAAAITRAALETELGQTKPRFLLYRQDTAILVAQSAELADFGVQLGKKADELAALDPLPNPIRVVENLRAINSPAGAPPLPEPSLVTLSAHVSGQASVSSKFEIYPRGMPAKRALMLAQNALTGVRELTVAQIRQRVLSRYPEAEPMPDRPELDGLLSGSGLDLVWHPELAHGIGAYRFRAYEEASTLSTGTILPQRAPTASPDSAPAGETSEEIADARIIENKLRRAEQEGAFLVLAVPPLLMRAAERELLHRFDLDRKNMDELVIHALRAGAQAARADWKVVLRADAAPQPSEDWKRLLLLVNRTMPKVEAELATSPKTLLLVNPGLLARYQQLEILVRLRDRIGRTGSPLHGLWVLVPTNGLAVLPTLDGHPVPVLGAAQWTQLTGAWIQNQHRA